MPNHRTIVPGHETSPGKWIHCHVKRGVRKICWGSLEKWDPVLLQSGYPLQSSQLLLSPPSVKVSKEKYSWSTSFWLLQHTCTRNEWLSPSICWTLKSQRSKKAEYNHTLTSATQSCHQYDKDTLGGILYSLNCYQRTNGKCSLDLLEDLY